MVKRKESLAQRVLRFIREHDLIVDQHPLVVAVSGGPDSVCLLHILLTLQNELGIRLQVAHLNHQLRSAEAKADAGYVADLARRLGVPATVERRDVKSYRAQHHICLEEAAREVRYTFLTEVAQSTGAERVAVGHTTDDHIETILMHLIRGSGTRGLRGLQPISRWQLAGNSLTIIRPLLTVSREETDAYCREHQLTPRLDASNLSLSPLRNRIRLQLLPLLRSYNPQVTAALLRTAAIAADDLAFITEAGSRSWQEVALEEAGTIIFMKKPLLGLPPALQRHLLRTAMEKLLGNLRDIEARHIEEIISALTKPAGKRIVLPADLVFTIEYDRYLLTRDPADLSPFPPLVGEFPLKIPGKTRLPGWLVTTTIIDRKEMTETDNFTAYLDFDKAGAELTVRARRRGDRFQPLGMGQVKTVAEFMIDAKVPHDWRERIPLVCSPTQIVWVVGWRIDERVKVSEETKKVLRLEFERR